VEWGTGNQVSAEFNLFYRWHSCISDRDDKWTQSLYGKLWPGKNPKYVFSFTETLFAKKRRVVPFHFILLMTSFVLLIPVSDITLHDMMMGLHKLEKSIPDDPVQRTYGNFKRGADGKLDDEELVQCLTESIEDLAGAFGANNVPQCMKVRGVFHKERTFHS
jgi:hypothetical protein